MTEPAYSNRELDQLFSSQKELIKAEFGALHSRMDNFESETSTDLMEIKQQTQKTNGRVSALEEAEVNNKIFRARVYTALGILTFIIGTIIVPLVAAYIGRA